MSTFKAPEDIEVWKLARELAKEIFEETNNGNFSKDFDHINQINRACGSIMDNIAEGFGRGGNKEFSNFLTYSMGSANEVKSQLYRPFDKGYFNKEKFDLYFHKNEFVINKLKKLISYINQSEHKGFKFKSRTN